MMGKPVFKFCIHRTGDDEEVWSEVSDIAARITVAARAAYLALPWWKKLSSEAIADAIGEACATALEDSIEGLRRQTVRL